MGLTVLLLSVESDKFGAIKCALHSAVNNSTYVLISVVDR